MGRVPRSATFSGSRSRAKLASLEINRRVRASLQIAALSGNGDFSVVSRPLRAALVVVLMLAYWRTRCFPAKAAMQRVVPCAGQIAEQPIAALPHPLVGEFDVKDERDAPTATMQLAGIVRCHRQEA